MKNTNNILINFVFQTQEYSYYYSSLIITVISPHFSCKNENGGYNFATMHYAVLREATNDKQIKVFSGHTMSTIIPDIYKVHYEGKFHCSIWVTFFKITFLTGIILWS